MTTSWLYAYVFCSQHYSRRLQQNKFNTITNARENIYFICKLGKHYFEKKTFFSDMLWYIIIITLTWSFCELYIHWRLLYISKLTCSQKLYSVIKLPCCWHSLQRDRSCKGAVLLSCAYCDACIFNQKRVDLEIMHQLPVKVCQWLTYVM